MRALRSPVWWYRIAFAVHRYRIPMIPRIIDLFIRFWYACWLPHTAQIGKRFQMGYGGLGCVVHFACQIGDDCHLGTHVTVGGNGTDPGIPKLGNKVYIGTGAKILGPVTIGDHVIIGANAVVVSDIPGGSVAVGVPARIVQTGINIDEFLWHKQQGPPAANKILSS